MKFVLQQKEKDDTLDKHGNKDKDWWCSVDNPGRNAGLLLGSKFL